MNNDLQNFLFTNRNISVSLTVDDLLSFAQFLINETKNELETIIIEDKQEVYLTKQQVAEMLSVNQVTLWRWEKLGYLNSINVGTKKRYRKSEIKTRFLQYEVQPSSFGDDQSVDCLTKKNKRLSVANQI